MPPHIISPPWPLLASKLKGQLLTDQTSRMLYATDASVYRKMPQAVAIPTDADDVVAIIKFAAEHSLAVTPRTAGTSLAGQAVGGGLVIDFSVHFNQILEINREEKWVRLQPGMIRDELNRALQPLGLWFSPNTSTANRCMIGGMVGNNSSGTTSIRYGVTRDKVLEANVVLSDGSRATFGEKSQEEIVLICSGDSLEAKIYAHLLDKLSQKEIADEVRAQYPRPGIHRRNTGYAVDELLRQQPFLPEGAPLNLAKLIAGAEGSLCLLTSVKLKLDDLPPPHEAVVCAHFNTLHEAMLATVHIMHHSPYAVELMDKTILDCTKDNMEQSENRFFVQGDPGAILAIELRDSTAEGLASQIAAITQKLHAQGLGFAYPTILPPDTKRVWDLRAAGLGVLSNVPGDAKPIAFVEDTAVEVTDLPKYIQEFEALMASFGQKAVYYAHAGAGELHLRPVLNLKRKEGQEQFRAIGAASARLVKKYGGALSGEHGDGRARSEFIPLVLGERNHALLKSIKATWDPKGLLNPGTIAEPAPMDADLRYTAGQAPFSGTTFLDFSAKGNILLAAEACNGSGDCRRLHTTGGTMCPSYQATRNEKDSTRARANVLREVLTRPVNPAYPLGSESLHEVLGLCLSCKACKRECPSSVDMSMLKAEADYQYQRRNGFSRRTRFFGHFHRAASLAAPFAPLVNAALRQKWLSDRMKLWLRISPERTLPAFARKKGTKLARKFAVSQGPHDLVLYIDEFTQYQDAHVAGAAARLLHALGYRFEVIYAPSARAYMSKGMLPEARSTAKATCAKLKNAVDKGLAIVGLEPSAILGFRDDLPALFTGAEKEAMHSLGKCAMTLEEFLAKGLEAGRWNSGAFTDESLEVHLHLHCHQKALSHVKHSKLLLSAPAGFRVRVIPSGCCGMAGSFGYEAEHHEVSMSIGELVLFPHVRQMHHAAVVVASGTSCRHQIADGTGVTAMHIAEVLYKALK